MPLPKPPSKPAALLAASDYPKAAPGKVVKPVIALVESNQHPASATEASITSLAAQPAAAPQAKISGKTLIEKPRPTPKIVDTRAKSQTSRTADKSGATKLFVLDTNVLMHDPTSLFRFEEHD